MTSDTLACTHRILEGNIREFVLTEVSRRAVDELFDITEKNLHEAALHPEIADLGLPVLIDSRVGVQSMNYSIIRLRMMINRFPKRRDGLIAIILPSSPLVRTLAILMRPILPVRIYVPDEREKALAWLRSSLEVRR